MIGIGCLGLDGKFSVQRVLGWGWVLEAVRFERL